MAVFLIVTSLGASVVGAEESNISNSEEKLLKQMAKFENIDDPNKLKKYKSKFKGFANRSLNIDNNLLKLEEAEIHSIKGTDLKVLTVPVGDNENYHESSNVSIYFDKNDKVTNYTEFYLTRSIDDNFEIKYLADGVIIIDEVVDEEFYVSSEQQNNGEISTFGFSAKKFAKCMGIPLAVANTIQIGCAAACIITAGAGCIVCIGVVAGFTGGKAAQCAAAAF